MSGRFGGHFATCLAAEIAFDGTVRISNAGHLPPYINGAEIALEGSLPLGLVNYAEYPVQTVKLRPGDRLTFMTDGVPEAKNAVNELFGFERTRAVSREAAAVIAQHAQIFGQEDDITVISVAFATPEH
jgi:phosphoserine phosphatase RsbU/P